MLLTVPVDDPSPTSGWLSVPQAVGVLRQAVGRRPHHLCGVFIINDLPLQKAGDPVGVDAAGQVVPNGDGGIGPRVIVEARGVVETAGLRDQFSEAHHAVPAVEEPPRRPQTHGRVVAREGCQFPREGRFVQHEDDQAEARLAAEAVEQRLQVARELGRNRDVRAHVRSVVLENRPVVVAQRTGMELHHETVLGTHARHFHQHVGREGRRVVHGAALPQGLVEDHRRPLPGQGLDTRYQGRVVRGRGTQFLEEHALLLQGLDEAVIIGDVAPRRGGEIVDVTTPAGRVQVDHLVRAEGGNHPSLPV